MNVGTTEVRTATTATGVERVETGAPSLERPWHRPGAVRYALSRLRSFVKPPVHAREPQPGSVVDEREIAVVVRDGTTLRVNVFRPVGSGRFPVLLSAHPYGKDRLPRKAGRRTRLSFQYRLMRQSVPLHISTLTSWEAPDPLWWVEQGYAVVNADLRGAGTSEGVGSLLDDQEADDIVDIVEWAGAQPWSSGRVGLFGVSYLAMSQYRAASKRPPSLAAMCPWEGLTDVYADMARPGGIPNGGFFRAWATVLRRQARLSTNLLAMQRDHPQRDGAWQAMIPDLSEIEVPMLVCTSFSDHAMHTAGSFRACERAGSTERFAYTHRAPKWGTFYGEPAKAAQRAFFDRYLKGTETPPPPRIRLEVREDYDTVTAVREEQEWPLARTDWQPLHLAPGGQLTTEPPVTAGGASFDTSRDAAAFRYVLERDTELTGPMALRLWVGVDDADDAHLVVGVEKWRNGRYVPFEGTYGFGRDRVTTGLQQASHRTLDPELSSPGQPVHTFTDPQPLRQGEIVPVDVALPPSATQFRAGEELRLLIAGRWMWPFNPLTGQFPSRYQRGPRTRVQLHWGPERPAHLLVPRIPS